MDPEKISNQKNRTQIEQNAIEHMITKIYDAYQVQDLEKEQIDDQTDEDEENKPQITHFLLRDFHVLYLQKHLRNCGSWGKIFDNGQPWMFYWLANSLDVLGTDINLKTDENMPEKAAEFLAKCQYKDGGFCGGPYQIPHLASTYAAILSIVIIGEPAYKIVDREGMYKFLMKMRNPNPKLKGSFLAHEKGECDMRCTYIAMVIADVLNIMTDELKENVGDYIASLQSYEGGIAASPFEEAHGGYTFCGFAGLCILGETHKVDLSKLLFWMVNRQLQNEGGFNGRTHKVVDACYTFWVGALFALINLCTGSKCNLDGRLLIDQEMVQKYVLLCGQDHESGGLRDKPGKTSDFYHCCYALSGLSQCQTKIGSDDKILYKGLKENELIPTDPIFNVDKEKLKKAKEYFKSLPPINIKKQQSIENSLHQQFNNQFLSNYLLTNFSKFQKNFQNPRPKASWFISFGRSDSNQMILNFTNL